MSALGRGRGLWNKPDKVKRFPVVIGSFANRGSDAINNAAKKFMQDSELILNSRCLEESIIELVQQHPGGLLVEHLPREYEHAYGKPLPSDWLSVVDQCHDLTRDSAPGLGTKLLINSAVTANYINQEAENTWTVEVLEVLSTVDITVRTDEDLVEKCSLCALEDFHMDEELTEFLKEVLCQCVFSCHLVSLEEPPSVVLYDDANANVNLRFAEQTALQVAPIQLREGMSPCVRVTYIADKQLCVWVRLTDQYFELLKRSLNMVMRLKSETRRKKFVVCKKDLKKLCVLQINNSWYRVMLWSQASLTEVTVRLIDVGSSVTVDPFSLVVLDSISTVFADVPAQAVEVTLDPVHNPAGVHDLLLHSKNHRSELVMKILKADKIQPPVVVFRDPAEKISSPKPIINSSPHQVAFPISTENTSSALSLNSKVRDENLSVTSDVATAPVVSDGEGNLKYWAIYSGKHFKVYVCSVTSPLDIMLQLSKNRPSLEIVMEMIQEHYESPTATVDSPGELQLKTAYAAFVNNWWYRVRIVRASGDEVWVHLMDYGTQVAVHSQQIRKLPKELGQDVLPFQSVRAELKGARERMLMNQDVPEGLENILLDKIFTCKVWSVENDHLCAARMQVDLYDNAGNSILDILYAAKPHAF